MMRYRAGIGCVLAAVASLVAVTAAQNRAPSAASQAAAAAAQSDKQFQAALQMEMVAGDCEAAIEEYRKISDRPGVARALAAEALLRMAGCYQKEGDAEAQKIYARLVSDFGDQPQATEARARLAPAAPGPTATLTPRLVWTQRPDEPGKIDSLSSDGRMAVMIRTVNGIDDIGLRDMSNGHVRWLGVTQSSEDDFAGALLSPDLRQVVYSDDLTTHTEFFIVATEGGATPKRLISNPDISDVIPAVWSADGKSILTAISRQDRTWQIAWVSAASGEITPLKSIEWRFRYDVDGLSLSPDGRYIAYSALATNPSKPRPALPESTETHIYVLAADGSSETALVTTPGINSQPVWTSDGGRILFKKGERPGSMGLWSIPMAGRLAAGAPALVKPDLGDVTVMPSTGSGSYFYTKQTNVERISIVAAKPVGRNGVDAVASAVETLVGSQAAWSPDGRSIALTRGSSRDARLVVHSLDSQEDRDYTSDHLVLGQPLWLHDGKAMLSFEFLPPAAGRFMPTMYRVDLASGDVMQVLAADPDRRRAAVVGLSPDDKTLYVTARTTKWVPGERSTQPNRILAIDLATNRERLVFTTPDDTGIFNPVLRPDGRSIAMTIGTPTAGSIDTVARVDVDGGGLRPLHALSPGERVVLAWSTDGRDVLFAPAQQAPRKVFRIPADGGTPQFTGLVLGGRGRFSLSPDGSRVAYSSNELAQQLWALDNLAEAVKGSR